jgi:argininosuccinate lyase
MSDDPQVSVKELIGRQPNLSPASASRRPGRMPIPDRHERLWLVLAAHLQGLVKTGVFDDRSGIIAAGMLERVSEPEPDAERGSFRDHIRSIEARLDSGLPTELEGAVGLGIATEDWVGTAVRLSLRAGALHAADAAVCMQGALIAMADLHSVSLMQGFLDGRPVQPVTFGHLLGGAIGPVGTGISSLMDSIALLNRSPLGAGTMSGAIVGAEREDTAASLGFAGTLPNTFDAVSNVEDIVGSLDRVAAVAAPVARMLDELGMLARTDPSSLVFGDGWMREDARLPGFSAVEGLYSLIARLRSVSSEAAGLVGRLRWVPYGPLGAAADWIDSDVTGIFRAAADRFDEVEQLFRSDLTVNRAYLANRAGRNYTTSNDLAAFLMSEEQLPPSVARNIASLTMRRVRDENVEMSAVTPEMVDTAAMLVIGRELKVEMETLGRWFAPRRFLERRLVEGSPAPARTRQWLEREAGEQRRMADAVVARLRHVTEAEGSVRGWIETSAVELPD